METGAALRQWPYTIDYQFMKKAAVGEVAGSDPGAKTDRAVLRGV